MKIIKKGKIKEVGKKITCYKCNSVLEYTHTDIETDPRNESHVVCPVCKSYITV